MTSYSCGIRINFLNIKKSNIESIIYFQEHAFNMLLRYFVESTLRESNSGRPYSTTAARNLERITYTAWEIIFR